MAALASVFVRVLPDAKLFEPQLKRQLAKVDAKPAGAKAGKSFAAGMSKPISGVAKSLAGAFAAVGVASLFKSAIGGASDLAETTSKVGQIFGKQSGAVQKFAKNANLSLGQTKQQALDAAATFAVFGKSAGLSGTKLTGFSTELVTLTADMASFSNTTPEEAIEAVGAALRGESEPIRKYGVLLDDATLRNRALKMGLIDSVKTALTPQNKALAAQAEILNQTKDAQGDFARTSGGLANQQKILSAQFTDMKTSVGAVALPLITKFVSLLNEKAIPFVKDMAATFREEWLPQIKSVAGQIGDKLGPAIEAFAGWVSNEAIPALKSFADWMSTNVVPEVKNFARWIQGTAVPAIKALWSWLAEHVIPTLGDFGSWLVQGTSKLKIIAGAVAALIVVTKLHTAAMAIQAAGGFVAYLAAVLKGIRLVTVVTKVWTAVTWALGIAMKFALGPVGLVITAISLLVAGVILAWKKSEKFREVVKDVWQKVKSAVATGVGAVINFMVKFADGILRGAEIAFGWIPGIKGKLKGARDALNDFKNKVNATLDAVRDENVVIKISSSGMSRVTKNLQAAAKSRYQGGATGADLSAHGGSLGFQATGLSTSPFRSAAEGYREKAGDDIYGDLQGIYKAAARRAKASADSGAGPAGKAGFPLPRGSYRVGRGTAGHGYASQDFPAPSGTPIYSIRAGGVIKALRLNRSYGIHAIIQHAGGLQSLYAHMSKMYVHQGQKVGGGQMIGRVGSTGNSTGPHLHFEARRNGRRINPRSAISYDQGGWLPTGPSLTVNNTGKPERIMAPHDEMTLDKRSITELAAAIGAEVLAGSRMVTDTALTGMARSSAAGLRYG